MKGRQQLLRSLSTFSSLALYHKQADLALDRLLSRFEQLDLPSADISLHQGVLTADLGPKVGTFVINKQPPTEQIWLSSPLSGPKRFGYCAGTDSWLSTRSQLELFSLVDGECEAVRGKQ